MDRKQFWIWSAMCVFLGVIVGFVFAPIKKGICCGNNNGNSSYLPREDYFLDDDDDLGDEDISF